MFVFSEPIAHAIPHEFIFKYEAGFNLAKIRRNKRNFNWPQSHYKLSSQCALPSPKCTVSSTVMPTVDHTTQPIFSHFSLHNVFILQWNVMKVADQQINLYVLVWDNMMFRHAAPVQNEFAKHSQFLVQSLPPSSPFLNPIQENLVLEKYITGSHFGTFL